MTLLAGVSSGSIVANLMRKPHIAQTTVGMRVEFRLSADDIRAFIVANAAQLKAKGDK